MKLRFKTDRRTDGQTDRDTSALVELRFAAKNVRGRVEVLSLARFKVNLVTQTGFIAA